MMHLQIIDSSPPFEDLRHSRGPNGAQMGPLYAQKRVLLRNPYICSVKGNPN